MSVTNVLERAGSCSEREMTAHYEYTRAVVQSRSLQYIGPVDQDDITQDAFMRFWLISEKQPISSPKAYIHRIVSTVIVDLARKYRPHLYQGLPVDEDGEVYEGLLLDAAELELHNPETIIEQQEACDELMEKLV